MKHTWLKRLGIVLGAIVLGAIGSGLWAEFLSPLWNTITENMVRLLAALSESFKNSIYSRAAKGFHEEYSLMLLFLLFGVLCGFYVALLLVKAVPRFDKPREAVRRFFRSKHEFVTFTFLVLVSIIMCMFLSLRAGYTNKITTGSLNSINIVSPYVGIQKTLELRSEFHRVKTSDDYKRFYQEMKALQKEHKVALPLFEPL